MALKEIQGALETSENKKPEALKQYYSTGVIMPYSSDLEPGTGEPKLSKFSNFTVVAAWKCYQNGIFNKFLLCGEQTFGPDRKSTSDLMVEKLLRLGVPEEDIESLPKTENLNNTAYQIKALAQYQQDKQQSSALVIGFDFHNERIQNHMQGFNVKGKTITAEQIIRYYLPKTNFDKLDGVLNEFGRKEGWLKKLSRIDPKGLIPRSITGMLGARVNNFEAQKIGLRFVNTTARKRLQEVEASRR